jgi:hypothetical protein
MRRYYRDEDWDREALLPAVHGYPDDIIDIARSPEALVPHPWRGHLSEHFAGDSRQRRRARIGPDALDHASI